jgi:hypothetical protein
VISRGDGSGWYRQVTEAERSRLTVACNLYVQLIFGGIWNHEGLAPEDSPVEWVRRDLNPHALVGQGILSPLCLPVPPLTLTRLASAVLASLFYTLVLRMSPSPGTDPPGYALASLDMSCLVTQDGGEFSRGGFPTWMRPTPRADKGTALRFLAFQAVVLLPFKL